MLKLKKIKTRRKTNNKMEYIYAALLLHKAGKEINEENLKKVVEAAGIAMDESKLKSLIASLKGVDIEKTLEEAASMPVATAGAAAGGAPEAKKAEKKEEKAEEAAEGLAALFG
jgi:large subunit ribosomal protein L12